MSKTAEKSKKSEIKIIQEKAFAEETTKIPDTLKLKMGTGFTLHSQKINTGDIICVLHSREKALYKYIVERDKNEAGFIAKGVDKLTLDTVSLTIKKKTPLKESRTLDTNFISEIRQLYCGFQDGDTCLLKRSY